MFWQLQTLPGPSSLLTRPPQHTQCMLQVEEGGIVRDSEVHQQVISTVTQKVTSHGFKACGSIQSPLKGAASGNTEFLALFARVEPQL